MLLGSEGTLAVITEAWVRVQPRPQRRRSATVTFPDFAAGLDAMREIVQAGLRPANCRLLEPEEARLTLARRRWRSQRALMVLGFEEVVEPADARASTLCRAHGGEVAEGRGGGAGAWREAFLRAPYLRDTFAAMGVLSETFETAITWERLPGFVAQVRGAAAGGARRGHRDVPRHARLSGRRGALLHRARARRAAGRRSSAGAPSRPPPRRRSSPPAGRSRTTTRSAATTARTTTASGPSRSRTPCAPPRPRSILARCLNPGVLFDAR